MIFRMYKNLDWSFFSFFSRVWRTDRH